MRAKDRIPQDEIIQACDCRPDGPLCDAHQLSRQQIAACYRGPAPMIDLDLEPLEARLVEGVGR